MEIEKEEKERKNVYANNVLGVSLHISVVEKGQKGYFCQGCGNELQAVKSTLPNRIHFYRHVATDVKIERKCTYSDESYRHKLAKEFLGRLKHIKLPAVYKFPPKDFQGQANLIHESVLFEAASVENEVAFYEDENGEVKWGAGHEVDDKYLFVRPDVTFFDINKNPILLIELVATHKVDIEKKAKLKRLGIDTVEVRIPKDSPAAIEAALYSSEKIKWIYNYDEEHTKYVPVPLSDSKGIPTVDSHQRRSFATTFECRQVEIRNLIRSIERVLESQQYGDAVAAIGAELSRVEANTKDNQSKLDGLREKHGNAINKRLAERRAKIEEERERIEAEEAELAQTDTNLGKRYNDKDEKLRIQFYEIGRKQKAIDRELSGEGEDEDGVGNSNSGTKSNLEQLIEFEKREIGRIEQELEAAPGEYKAAEDKLIERFSESTGLEEREIGRIERRIAALPGDYNSEEKRLSKWLESEEDGLSKSFKYQEGELPGEFKSKEDDLEREFEKLREQSLQAIVSRNGVGISNIAVRIRKLLEARGCLNDIGEVQKLFRRYKRAWECFKDGSYESWNK